RCDGSFRRRAAVLPALSRHPRARGPSSGGARLLRRDHPADRRPRDPGASLGLHRGRARQEHELMSDSFVPVATLSQLAPGEAIDVVIGGTEIALVRDEDGDVHALEDVCSHQDIPSPTGMSRAAPSNAGSTAASSTCAQAGRCSCRPCCPSPSTRCGWTRPPARSRSIRPGSSPPEHSTTPSSHPHRGEPHMSILEIKDLHATVETPEGTKEILKGVDLTIKGGEIH